MAETDALIAQLTQDKTTGRLPAPSKRALAWFAATLPYVALIVLVAGPRADLAAKLGETRYIVEQGAAIVTAGLAAFAAFCATVPGRPRGLLLLPLVPLAVWLGSVGQGCIREWMAAGGNIVLQADWMCLPAIAVVGAWPALVMAAMIRRGAPLYPHLAVGLGGLAAAALGNVGLRLFHATDASLMILVWQIGAVALFTALAGCCGPRVHNWRRLTPISARKNP